MESIDVLLIFGSICDVLRDLVPFEQFKKRENTHGGVLFLAKLQTISKYAKCTNGNKWRNASNI